MGIRGRVVTTDPLQMDLFAFSSTARPIEPTRADLKSTVPAEKSGATESLVLPPPYESKPKDTPPLLNQSNYRITDSDKLGIGSLRQKARDNLTALETLQRLDSEARAPSNEEKKLLVRYVGWGGLPQVFDERNERWVAEGKRLRTILTEEEFESARATTLNAHYSSPTVVKAMYELLERLGFRTGRILEPACGLGHFFGLMPKSILEGSQLTGVEIDSVTARMAKLLYPDASIRQVPFESSKLPDDYFDVAISNVPFGDYQPFDPRWNKWKLQIHDYFFVASLMKVRPGGLVIFITSRGTLDKGDSMPRKLISQSADLIGAIRLPNDTFKENANTEVTTDIVVLRRKFPGDATSDIKWREIVPSTNSLGESTPVNEYFAARPEMMLGEMRLTGKMYGGHEPTLVGSCRDLGEHLREAILRFPEAVYQPAAERTRVAGPEPTKFSAPTEVKPNAYALVGGEMMRREGDQMCPLKVLTSTAVQRLRGLIRVRDAMRQCLLAEWEGQADADLDTARQMLNQTYDQFVQRYGPLSERGNVSAFKGDPDAPLLLSLEKYSPQTGKATKAAIFSERTIAPRRSVATATDPRSALLVALNERGCVDLSFMAELLHQQPHELLPELKGLVFLNPKTQCWETDDDYLCGNVREKLQTAEAAVHLDSRFQANVDALREVQPEDLVSTDIDARLGSTWLPPPDIKQFAEDLLCESGVHVKYAPVIGAWTVRADWNVVSSVANSTEWGTERRSAIELLEDALNLKTPTVYDRDSHGDATVVDGPATEAARDRQQKLKDRFQTWVWEADERRERLCRMYNDQFNAVRLRTFSGEHLTLPGASSAIVLHRHQKAAVWRILQTPNCLLGHVVGAGKSYTMVAAAMELKRLGLARKPLLVVPNHMLGQFSSELLTLYPGANLLVATREDFEKKRRQTLMSRIATGNWDAVIVTHSGFEKIQVSRATQEAFFKEQIEELEFAIVEQRQERGSAIVKELEKAKKRLQTRLQLLSADDRKDEGLSFEQLGVDRLFVDEAHYFKNLFYVTKMTRIAGLPQTASQRAFDMLLKVRHVQEQNHGGGVVFATGTPIANSVAEMFTMQRYLQMSTLKALHVDHFDSWAGTFGEPVTAMELSPDGAGYRLNTRFARFINVPELMQQFRQVADIQTQGMLKLAIPALRGGKPTVVSAPASRQLKDIVKELVVRADAIRARRVLPNEDNMLLVTTDGRKAALDLRLHDSMLPDFPESKVNRAVAIIERIWRETEEERSTQLVFCDLSAPSGGLGFSVYEDIRQKLVSAGVPANEVAFIQDARTDAAKAALFRDVRTGAVRVLLGSTQKMGSGTNVQDKLVALHHLDAPWRPADVEQREGRILRQGNSNAEVQVFRYVTEESFDAYMWQTLETKAKFIAQVMSGNSSLRRMEDIDGAALTYAEVKAIASGNPLVIEKAQVDSEVARLSRLRSEHVESQFSIRSQTRQASEEIPRLERRIEALQSDIASRVDTRGDRFVVELGKDILTERGVAGELLIREAEKLRGTKREQLIGRFAGFEIWVADSFTTEMPILIRGATTHTAYAQKTALGTMRAVEHVVGYLEERLQDTTSKLTQTRRRLADLTAQNGLPFEYAEKLSTLLRRQSELFSALDLTKAQGSAALGGDSSELPTLTEPATLNDGDWSW